MVFCCLKYSSSWLVGCWGFTTVPVTKTIRLSEWVTPGYTAIPGMTSLKDGDLQHSSALAQISKGDIEPNQPSEINPNSDSRSRSDGRSRRFVQYRVDHGVSRTETKITSSDLFPKYSSNDYSYYLKQAPFSIFAC